MSQLRWGILGSGSIAHTFAKSLRCVEGAVLEAVASCTPGRAEIFAKQHEVARFTSSYESLLQMKDVDCVYIANTHNFHFETVSLALRHNKHVLCEKPLAINARQCEELFVLAEKKQRFLMEGMWTRFLPAIAAAEKWIESGEIGEVKRVKADFSIGLKREAEARWFNPMLAGGSLLDVGIYPLAFSQMFMGSSIEELQVYADFGESKVDEQCIIQISHGAGRYSQLSSAITVNGSNQAEIIGTRGQIRFPSMFFMTDELSLFRGEDILKPVKTLRFPIPEGTGFRYEILEVQACIAAGKTQSALWPHQSTLSVMRVMDRIREKIGLRYPEE